MVEVTRGDVVLVTLPGDYGKRRSGVVVQSDLFADIRLRKHKMFDAVFAGPDAMSQIEEQYL